ncbi:uncharacterized protein V1510DRAFT_430527 [Dipodascopsis tothii]|uniref:uncharacterized protein n=1 Tax=Dipodascopsis tothii TaxID=44089 RepID=UPI0034CDCEF1
MNRQSYYEDMVEFDRTRAEFVHAFADAPRPVTALEVDSVEFPSFDESKENVSFVASSRKTSANVRRADVSVATVCSVRVSLAELSMRAEDMLRTLDTDDGWDDGATAVDRRTTCSLSTRRAWSRPAVADPFGDPADPFGDSGEVAERSDPFADSWADPFSDQGSLPVSIPASVPVSVPMSEADVYVDARASPQASAGDESAGSWQIYAEVEDLLQADTDGAVREWLGAVDCSLASPAPQRPALKDVAARLEALVEAADERGSPGPWAQGAGALVERSYSESESDLSSEWSAGPDALVAAVHDSVCATDDAYAELVSRLLALPPDSLQPSVGRLAAAIRAAHAQRAYQSEQLLALATGLAGTGEGAARRAAPQEAARGAAECAARRAARPVLAIVVPPRDAPTPVSLASSASSVSSAVFEFSPAAASGASVSDAEEDSGLACKPYTARTSPAGYDSFDSSSGGDRTFDDLFHKHDRRDDLISRHSRNDAADREKVAMSYQRPLTDDEDGSGRGTPGPPPGVPGYGHDAALGNGLGAVGAGFFDFTTVPGGDGKLPGAAGAAGAVAGGVESPDSGAYGDLFKYFSGGSLDTGLADSFAVDKDGYGAAGAATTDPTMLQVHDFGAYRGRSPSVHSEYSSVAPSPYLSAVSDFGQSPGSVQASPSPLPMDGPGEFLSTDLEDMFAFTISEPSGDGGLGGLGLDLGAHHTSPPVISPPVLSPPGLSPRPLTPSPEINIEDVSEYGPDGLAPGMVGLAPPLAASPASLAPGTPAGYRRRSQSESSLGYDGAVNNTLTLPPSRGRSRSSTTSSHSRDSSVASEYSSYGSEYDSDEDDRSRRGSVSRSPSAEGRRDGSAGRRRRSASANRDYILDLAQPSRSDRRVQRHPANYACTLCSKKFTRAYNLRSHLRTHTDERPFVCTVCGKAFARQHDRKRHEELHTGVKKFECRGELLNGAGVWGCGRKFARADALGRHFRSEAGRECIRPLLEEEAREYASADRNYDALLGQGAYAQQYVGQPGANGLLAVGAPNPAVNWLPLSLLQQYPALAKWDGSDDVGGSDVGDASGGEYAG